MKEEFLTKLIGQDEDIDDVPEEEEGSDEELGDEELDEEYLGDEEETDYLEE